MREGVAQTTDACRKLRHCPARHFQQNSISMSSSRRQYPFHLIEPKWQQFWDEQQTFRAFNPAKPFRTGTRLPGAINLSGKVAAAQLPIKVLHPRHVSVSVRSGPARRPSGGLHRHGYSWRATNAPRACTYCIRWVGTPSACRRSSTPSRPASNPRQTTEANVANFTKQIKSLGFSYDWSRELATTDPDYFKWTQWIFLKLYNSWFNPETNKAEPIEALKYPKELENVGQASSLSQTSKKNGDRQDACPTNELESRRRAYRDSKRLAYVSEQPVWWCEQLGTVLANEEVVDGKSEVGGFLSFANPCASGCSASPAYAEKLLADLDTIDWTDSLKEMQRNWIGRSEGAEVDFQIADCGLRIADLEKHIRVFTTRPGHFVWRDLHGAVAGA